MQFRKIQVAACVASVFGMIALAQAGSTDHPAVSRALAHLQGVQNRSMVASYADEQWNLTDLVLDTSGDEHVRFARNYKGLPVIGGDLVVHGNAKGALKGMSKTHGHGMKLDTKASLEDGTAISIAEAQFIGRKTGVTQSEQVIYARGAKPVMAYKVQVLGEKFDGTPSEMNFIVDANSGRVLDRFDGIQTSAAAGTGKSLFSGSVSLTLDYASGSYALRDPSRGNHYVTDMKNRTSGSGTLMSSADNLFGNFATTDLQTVGVDAQYGQNVTWDFYKNVLGRSGIDGAGRAGYSKVHQGRDYINAFWSDSCFCMSYGDGKLSSGFKPLVSIDVAGHEMSHGVTSRTAKLVYSGESGGLNEATSDIFGTMVEYYAGNAKDTGDYMIGEELYTANDGLAVKTKAMRYMFKPSLDGASPDCYSSTLGNLDVHYSSGVANHFFFLLAEGAVVPAGFGAGTAKNLSAASLVCNGNTAITGIGRDAASKIWYRALSTYMTSSSNYAAARAATLNAATDLYGATSTQRAAVAAAWSAVSVN